ncbi:hypothetical protein [Nonomuraea composti]|uniref:hypothetical protein n=1 Tax=Nonomuraea composti TaxID=2720023 RepID=UPI001F0DE771|nr:hypothetical protein [Nonomuraea sp. FMUSA5-5]
MSTLPTGPGSGPGSGLLTGTPLAGRVAVVSRASSGIGAATATRLAELGASCPTSPPRPGTAGPPT